MLLALRPAHPPMDSFRHNEHDPDRIPGIRNRPARKSPRTSPSLDQQRQLPSFREVVLPSLHTAIESAATTEASISKRLPRLDTSGQPPIGRPPGSVLASPIFSQSSSMPDSFEELGQKNYESLNQIAPQRPTVPYQPPDQIAPQRSSASWPVNPTYPDMATSYAQRAPYYPQPMSQLKHEPGLPSIRDMPFASPTIPSPSYNTVYGASSQGPLPMDYGNSFRRSSYTDGRQLSQTYPPYARPYSMDKYDPGYRSQNLPHSVYSQPYTDYQSNYHTSMGHGPYHSMDHHSSSKKRRGNLPKPVTDILRNWLHQNMEHPYPTEEEKNQLIERTGLSMAQISNWFINARRRHLPAMKEKAQQQNKMKQDHDRIR